MTSVGSSPFVSPCSREDEELGPDAARASPEIEGLLGENKYPDADWDQPPANTTANTKYAGVISKVPPLRTDIS